jgi:hypothetical protein
VFCLRSYVSLPVQIHDHAKGNDGYIQIHPLVSRPANSFTQYVVTRTSTAIATPTASRTTAAASSAAASSATTTGPTTWTRTYTIPVIAEVGCADSNVLLETATFRHPVCAIIGTATVECEDIPWKSLNKRPKFYLCLIIQAIPHHLK